MASLVQMAAGLALLTAGQTPAGTCNIQSNSPPGQWIFFRVYDVATGQEVLRQAINGGDIKTISVMHDRVKIERKTPGQTEYLTAAVTTCKDGNTIKA
jgi:hypothetical protein